MRKSFIVLSMLSVGIILAGCDKDPHQAATPETGSSVAPAAAGTTAASWAGRHLDDYATVKLDADLSALDADQKRMLARLVEAAQSMDTLWWQQSVTDKGALEARIHDDATRRLFAINYGPWDRLNDDHPFVEGVGSRPPGLQFYPHDMSNEEFDAAALDDKAGLYTLLRRDAEGKLVTVPYHEAYRADLEKTAGLLRDAAGLAKHDGFRKYLQMRADALLSDDYRASDFAWMATQDNPVDIVIGPIENYEDQLYGYKTSYEAYVLIKDREWSKKLQRFAAYLPELQRDLPVADAYKAEKPGSDADLNAYFAVYYGGDANVGAKTIAINLPNDERVQLQKGTRRLQLENVMKAKFDKIMLPIGHELIAGDQQKNLTFDAFFQNTMFHEVAHGLGIKHTVDGKSSVRKALKEQASSFEEGKADVLGLYMVEKLADKGELDKSKLMDNYVTFLDGMLRSVRFGTADAHAKANMVRFNYFVDKGAITRDGDGRYRVDAERMHEAIRSLSNAILTIQGNGDHDGARAMTESMGKIGPQLADDLERLKTARIPVDVTFEQGLDVLGLEKP